MNCAFCVCAGEGLTSERKLATPPTLVLFWPCPPNSTSSKNGTRQRALRQPRRLVQILPRFVIRLLAIRLRGGWVGGGREQSSSIRHISPSSPSARAPPPLVYISLIRNYVALCRDIGNSEDVRPNDTRHDGLHHLFGRRRRHGRPRDGRRRRRWERVGAG